jgi:dihydroneopterin aldolase
MTSQIEIRDLELQAFHGVLSQERVVGNLYSIDASLDVDISAAMESDQLSDTVNYAAVVWLIQEEMAQPSQLIEHVAGRILQRIHRTWPQVASVDLRIAKLAPPIEAKVGACAVHVREDFTR